MEGGGREGVGGGAVVVMMVVVVAVAGGLGFIKIQYKMVKQKRLSRATPRSTSTAHC